MMSESESKLVLSDLFYSATTMTAWLKIQLDWAMKTEQNLVNQSVHITYFNILTFLSKNLIMHNKSFYIQFNITFTPNDYSIYIGYLEVAIVMYVVGNLTIL